MAKKARSKPASDLNYKLIFGIIALLCYIRIYFGVSAMDEAQHVGSAFLTSWGGKPFYNEMYLQQIAGLLYEPLAILYYKIMGRTGIYLFARHLFFALSLLCAWIYYRCYKDKVSQPILLAISTIPLFATVNGWPTINYHTLGSLGMGVSILLSVRSVEKRSAKIAAAAGFAFFVAVAGYPTIAATAVLTWLCIGTICLYRGRPFWREFFVCAGVTTGLFLLFAGYLYLRFDPTDIVESFYFSKAFNTFGSFTQKMLYSAWLFSGWAPQWWMFFPAAAIWVFAWIKKDVPIFAFAIPLFIAMHFKDPSPPEAGGYPSAFYIIIAVLGLIPLIHVLKKAPERYWGQIVFWIAGMGTAVLVCWSSGLTIYSTVLATPLLFAPILAASDFGHRYWRNYSAAFVVVFLLYFHFLKIPDDDRLPLLTQQIESGPFAGLITSEQQYQFLTTLQADINECAEKGKSALFYDHFPGGFLMSDMFPATRTLFMHDIGLSWPVRSMYRTYYEDSKNRPDCVFRFLSISTTTGFDYDVGPDKYLPMEDVFWRYLPEETGDYRLLRERRTYSVYQKKNL